VQRRRFLYATAPAAKSRSRVPGAVREPPLQRPATPEMQTWGCALTCIGSFQGTAPPCPYTTGKWAWFRQSTALPAGNVGATRWVAHSVRRTYGRRVGSPRYHRARWHQGDAPRRPYNFCVRRWVAAGTCAGTAAAGRRTASPLQHTETRVWWGRACTPTPCERDRHLTRQDQRRFANRPYRDAVVEPVVPWPGGARVLPASAPTVVQTC